MATLDLDEGVELLRTADRIIPADHPSRATALMNLDLLLFHRFHARHDPRDAPRHHRLAGAGRADEEQIVAAGRRDLERPSRQKLTANVREVRPVSRS